MALYQIDFQETTLNEKLKNFIEEDFIFPIKNALFGLDSILELY